MFATNPGYSLSDITAATGGLNNRDGAWGGNGAWWIIILFVLFFGWGNRGWGNNGNDGCGCAGSVRDEIAYGFDINGLERGVRGIQQGLCDGFYAMNTGMLNGFSGLQSTMCQGFNGLNMEGMQNTCRLENQLFNMSARQDACCCETQREIEKGFCDLNYNLATQTCNTQRAICDSTRDIIDNQNAGVRQVLDFLTQDKIAALTAENQTLKFAASQQAQNNYLVDKLSEPCPIPAFMVPNPNCCNTNFGCFTPNFNRCGCGCGCN